MAATFIQDTFDGMVNRAEDAKMLLHISPLPGDSRSCLAVIYSNIVALNTRLFTRYARGHPSKKINTKRLPEKLFRCLREP